MKTVPNHLSETGWRLLGELELSVVAEADGAVRAWLAKALAPLKLHGDFLSKVTKSVHNAAAHATTSEHVQMEFRQMHLRILIPIKKASELNKGHTWGFFRIEKVGISTKTGDAYDHSIDFYLYLEG